MLYKPHIQSGCLIKEEFTLGDINMVWQITVCA